MPFLYTGVFFTSLSVLLFEIALTRIFSVTLWYHFAYFVVSMALFGLGAGGLGAFFASSYLHRLGRRSLAHAAFLQFLSVVMCLYVILNFDLKIGFTVTGILHLSVLYLMCSMPFFFAGLIISLSFTWHYLRTPKIYFFDLMGSALGCLLFIAAITYVTGPSVVLVSACLCLCSMALFSLYAGKVPGRVTIAVVVIMAVATMYANIATGLFDIKYTKTYSERKDILYEKWSPLARVTVYPGVFWDTAPDRPFTWGASDKYRVKRPIKQLWIEQDSHAGTVITAFDGDMSKLVFLKYDITSLAYYLREAPETFIIGVGGGRDVLTALGFNASSVTAVDINPVIINLVKDRYREFAGNLYNLPGVNVEVAEARNYIQNSRQRFDIIQISLIDSWAATTAGAFALAENNLYTVEAFTDYLDHLNDNGMLSVSRYLFEPSSQTLRVAVLARTALERMGASDPSKHIAVVGTTVGDKVATVLVKRTPFTFREAMSIMTLSEELGFAPLYVPGYEYDRVFSTALRAEEPEKFFADYPYDMSPSTDDRPFFFQMVRFSDALNLVTGKEFKGQKFNYYAVSVIAALMLISFIMTIIFYIMPLALSRRTEPVSFRWGLYFIFLGLGFMLVEIPLIQKGSLYLGHPTYGLSVVLFSMLIFAGLGSYWSGRLKRGNLKRTLYLLMFIAAVLISMATLAMEVVMPATMWLPLWLKGLITVGFGGIMAFVMGTAFPTGIRLLGRTHPRSIPWVWALNGGASVMGSIMAMGISMNYGYRFTLIAGAATYLMASLMMKLKKEAAQG